MTQHSQDDLWRDFPRTATEFEARFATEEDCRAYWIEARWGGKPACTRCKSTRVWAIREGTTFQCADCRHQTSLTSGTLLEKTHKPPEDVGSARCSRSRRAVPASRPRTCSASWGSAPTRRRGPGCTSSGRRWCGRSASHSALSCRWTRRWWAEKAGPHKELVLVAAEAGGRVRLAHAETNDKATLRRFADGQIAPDARVVTDGLASYDSDSLRNRPYERIVQTKAERREGDTLQVCHWTISLLKRWLLGTHAGAVGPKHLQAYLDEFAFRHNRRKTNGVGRIAARVIEQLVGRQPLTMRSLIDDTRRCRCFRSVQPA